MLGSWRFHASIVGVFQTEQGLAWVLDSCSVCVGSPLRTSFISGGDLETVFMKH